jgi:hypothetical protein
VSLENFSVASENSMCPWSTKNEYHDTPGVKMADACGCEPADRGWKPPEATQCEDALPELQKILTMDLVGIGNNSGVEMNL